MLENFDPNAIQDLEGARQAITQLLNLIEDLTADLREAQAEIQRLRDENNRLKGGQGKPNIPPSKKPLASDPGKHSQRDFQSSERERHKPQAWKKSSKVDQIHVDREQVAKVNPAQLPPDAEFKGHEPVIVHASRLVIHTDNIRFLKEKYYSPTQAKTRYAWPNCPKGMRASLDPALKRRCGCGITA